MASTAATICFACFGCCGHRQVCGQFNRGFIITRLRGDLYIVDQHASDEKRRFEELQRTTAIQTQPFIRPLRLEFAASEEETIINHLDVFEKNGAECLLRDTRLAPHRTVATAAAAAAAETERRSQAKPVGDAERLSITSAGLVVCVRCLPTGFSIHYNADAPLTQRLQLRSVRPARDCNVQLVRHTTENPGVQHAAIHGRTNANIFGKAAVAGLFHGFSHAGQWVLS